MGRVINDSDDINIVFLLPPAFDWNLIAMHFVNLSLLFYPHLL